MPFKPNLSRRSVWPMAGWKIGATNAKSQEMMQLSGPFYGPMPADACVASDSAKAMPPGAIGAEIEIAFKLVADLPKRTDEYELGDVSAAIEGVYPAIEIIGLRQIWQGVPEGRHAIADLGANCIFAHSLQPVPNLAGILASDPVSIQARCLIDGDERGNGDASLVLGNPLEALRWLANNGPGLSAGQWISTGTMTGLAPISAPCTILGDFGEFGQVRLSLTA